MTADQIAALIRTALPRAEVRVVGPDEVHFEAIVVAPEFEGKRTLARHQMIYAALGGRVGGEIHALSITACTPGEWQARQAP
jgi:acid stress-induced BolA-like protein IbaG/YrbA